METILPNSTRALKTTTTTTIKQQPINNGVAMGTKVPQQQSPYPTDLTASMQMPQPHPPGNYSPQPVATAQQPMPQPHPLMNPQPHPHMNQAMPHPHVEQPMSQQHVTHPMPEPHPPVVQPMPEPHPQPLVTQSLSAVQLSTDAKTNNELPLRRAATQRGSMTDRPPMPQPRPLFVSTPAEYLEPAQLNMPPSATSVTTTAATTGVIQNGEFGFHSLPLLSIRYLYIL